MALNKEYFDSIHIDVVKKKYYNANKVNAVFEDIRRQAEQLSEENEQMRAQLDTLNGTKFEIGDAILTAQAVYKDLVEKAKARADEIVREAEQQKKEILDAAISQQEYAVQRVERCYSAIKAQHMASIEAINAEWQDFLCGLYPDDKALPEEIRMPAAEPEKLFTPVPEKKDILVKPAPADKKTAPEGREEAAHAGNISQQDIEDKIKSIADELFSDI